MFIEKKNMAHCFPLEIKRKALANYGVFFLFKESYLVCGKIQNHFNESFTGSRNLYADLFLLKYNVKSNALSNLRN